MKFIKKALLLLGCCAVFASAKTLPVESSLITGELENGLKYTIKKHKKPVERATMRLLVKAGSLEEDDDQKGVAHLVEHMAFNGTKNFQGNDLIKFLESIGVNFGSHLNASTSTTQTLYKLEIPLKNDNLEKAMLIFGDWAGGINFTQKELDKERGVVLEEARARNDVNFRLYLKAKDVIYEGSKYKDRTPIGDKEIIKNIKLERVKAFYNDWYRPELMHFVIAGDIDVKETEELIKKTFSYLKNNSKRQQASRVVPKVEKTRMLFLKDKELTSSKVSIDFVTDYKSIKTEEDYKEAITRTIMSKLFNTKASEQLIKRNPAARSIRLLSRKVGSNLRTYSFYAGYTGLKEIGALKELTNLMYSLEKFGFNKDDFNRAIKELKKSNKESIKSLENKTSGSYVGQITSYAVYDDIFIDEKYRIELTDKLLGQITLAEVDKLYKSILLLKSQLISYQVAPNIEISKKQIKKVIKNARNNVKKEVETSNLPQRIAIPDLKPAKIVKEIYNKKYDFYEFTLENGVKIAYKFNDYNKNSVGLSAFSKGGYSIYDTKDLTNAKYATNVITKSGLDKYNILDVQKIYSDKTVRIQPKIGRYSETLNGSSITKDFEFLMEGIYLLTTKYRFDDNILENTKQIALANLKKENRVPAKKYSRELMEFYYNGNKRFTNLSKEDIESINKEDLLKIYKDRFSDLNNFMFIITGDIDKESVKKYTSLYLGNIPTDKRKETFNFRGIKPLKGEHKFIRNFNNEDISSVSLSYSKEVPYSLEESIRLSAFKDVLSTKLRELIREEKSGVYGISVRNSFQREPYSKASITISFTCDPTRKDELVKYIKEEIENIKTKEVEAKYVNSFIKKRVLGLEQSKKTAKFWSGQIRSHYYYGDDLSKIDNYKNHYKSITPIIVKDTANKYLDTINIIYTELNPKTLDK